MATANADFNPATQYCAVGNTGHARAHIECDRFAGRENSRRRSTVAVLEANDIVLSEIRTGLHLDQH